jgi:hypothetical protein
VALRARGIKLLDDDYRKQGKRVRDTIELLEAIGREASLRHASIAELTDILEQAQAPGALTAAVMLGGSSRLSEKFGYTLMHAPQVSQAPGHEGDDEPHHPLALDHGKSSQR